MLFDDASNISMLGNDGALSIEDVNQLLDWKVAVSHALTSSSSIVQPPTTHVVSALLCGPASIPIVTHVVTADEVQIINESDEICAYGNGAHIQSWN